MREVLPGKADAEPSQQGNVTRAVWDVDIDAGSGGPLMEGAAAGSGSCCGADL